MSLLSGASLYVGFVVSCLCVSLAVGMCFIMSLLAGSALAVWVLNLLLGFGLPVERHFHNESSFWVRSCCLGFALVSGSDLAACFWGNSSCWVFDLLFGCRKEHRIFFEFFDLVA